VCVDYADPKRGTIAVERNSNLIFLYKSQEFFLRKRLPSSPPQSFAYWLLA